MICHGVPYIHLVHKPLQAREQVQQHPQHALGRIPRKLAHTVNMTGRIYSDVYHSFESVHATTVSRATDEEGRDGMGVSQPVQEVRREDLNYQLPLTRSGSSSPRIRILGRRGAIGMRSDIEGRLGLADAPC